MDLDDAINSYETAIGQLPPSPEKLSARLPKACKAAKRQFDISFHGYTVSHPGSLSLRGSLARVVKATRDMIGPFKTELRPLPAATGLLELLLTRDEIRRISKEGPTPSATLVTRLAALDQRLKEWAKSRRVGADRPTMSRWRETIQPEAGQWWWSLDDVAKPHALWTLFAGLFFAGSIAVGADTFSILKNVTTTNVSAIGTIVQSILALIAGSAFTSSGREWLGNAFSAIGIDRRFRGASRMGLALVVFLVIVLLWFRLPVMANRYYISKGAEYENSGLFARSIESYQQAIVLKPRQLDAHFGLANSLVKSHEYDKAIEQYKRISEIDPDQAGVVNDHLFDLAVTLDRSREYEKAMALYKRVMELDVNQFSAVNNQARLYIVHLKDPRGAILLLNRLSDRVNELPDEARYYTFKNLGWAWLEMKSTSDAEVWLRAALNALDGQGKQELRARCGAAARFLLGKTLESQQNRLDEALREWDLFAELLQQHEEQSNEVEPEWPGYVQSKTISHARTQSNQKGVEKNEK